MIESKNNFSEILLSWFSLNKRDLPWRKNPDPYNVWLSEIILQQTRVIQGLPYYEAFTERFPTIFDLAAADEEEVLRLWQGLGYYSRARNLHFTAKTIVEKYDGNFPATYSDIVKLKGIGPYTAAAIASICFKEAVPVIDGNVFRFISRVFGVHDDISIPKSRKVFESILVTLIDQSVPGDFNQGMMEMGALICKPSSPLCSNCNFREMCYAFANKSQESLPVKSKKTKVKERRISYLVWKYNDLIAMRKREDGDIWSGLYDFDEENKKALVALEEPQEIYSTTHMSNEVSHQLSHQRITATFEVREVKTREVFDIILENGKLSAFSFEEVLTLPKPKLIVNYLNGLTN